MDKLEALSDTVAEILRAPASPPSYFDAEPDADKQSGEIPASVHPWPGTESSKEDSGKLATRKFGVAQSVSEVRAASESVYIARRALSDESVIAHPDSGSELLSKPSHRSQETVSPERQVPDKSGLNAAYRNDRARLGGWPLRVAGILLVAGIGTLAVVWFRSPGNAAKSAPSQPQALMQGTPMPTRSPEPTPLLRSISSDLASMGREIEQLKAAREQLARDNASLGEQLKANQEQLARAVARLSEQLTVSQEQSKRDNANVLGQVREIQERLAVVNSHASERAASPKVVSQSRPTALPQRLPVSRTRQPTQLPSSTQVVAKPKVKKPKSVATSRPPSPAH